MARKLTFSRSFLLVFPLVFIALYAIGLSPGKVVYYSLLVSFMLGWIIRVLTHTSSRCLESSLYEQEQIDLADEKRFTPKLEEAEKLKKRGEYGEAEKIINNIIALRPRYVPGLWFKVQILNATGGDDAEIRRYLRLVMENTPVEDRIFKLASDMHEKLIKREPDSGNA